MIVHPTPDVLRVLFTLKGSIVKRIALRCLTITLLAALIVLVERHFPAFFYPVSATPLMVCALSTFASKRPCRAPSSVNIGKTILVSAVMSVAPTPVTEEITR